MPIASLNIDSPKIIAFKSASASISLNIAMTETGSVAEIKLPKAKASRQVNSGENAVWPTNQNRIEEQKIAINVPKKLYDRTDPKFLKKGFFCRL